VWRVFSNLRVQRASALELSVAGVGMSVEAPPLGGMLSPANEELVLAALHEDLTAMAHGQ
jgi:hypothetical protein